MSVKACDWAFFSSFIFASKKLYKTNKTKQNNKKTDSPAPIKNKTKKKTKQKKNSTTTTTSTKNNNKQKHHERKENKNECNFVTLFSFSSFHPLWLRKYLDKSVFIRANILELYIYKQVSLMETFFFQCKNCMKFSYKFKHQMNNTV